MRCAHNGCEDDGPLYRANAKGQPGVFMCSTHILDDPDPIVKKIAEMAASIGKKNR